MSTSPHTPWHESSPLFSRHSPSPVCPASNLKSFTCSSLSSGSSSNYWSYQAVWYELLPSSPASLQPCRLAAAKLICLQFLNCTMHFSAFQSLHTLIFLSRTSSHLSSVINSVCLLIPSLCLLEAFFSVPPLPFNTLSCALLTASVALVTFTALGCWFVHLNSPADN